MGRKWVNHGYDITFQIIDRKWVPGRPLAARPIFRATAQGTPRVAMARADHAVTFGLRGVWYYPAAT